MIRWMLVLECTHKVASDTPARRVDDREHCPEHGQTFPIVECYAFDDTDLDDALGQGRR